DNILSIAQEKNVSDIHITVGIPPVFRLNGKLQRFGEEVITPQLSKEIGKAIMPEQLWMTFLEKGEMDYSYSLPGVARFRVNSFQQRGSISHAFRMIPTHVPTVE